VLNLIKKVEPRGASLESPIYGFNQIMLGKEIR